MRSVEPLAGGHGQGVTRFPNLEADKCTDCADEKESEDEDVLGGDVCTTDIRARHLGVDTSNHLLQLSQVLPLKQRK